jgi:hypothetical protein
MDQMLLGELGVGHSLQMPVGESKHNRLHLTADAYRLGLRACVGDRLTFTALANTKIS